MRPWFQNSGLIMASAMAGIGIVMIGSLFFRAADPSATVNKHYSLQAITPLSAQETGTAASSIRTRCAGNQETPCLQRSLLDLIPEHGPKAAMDALARLLYEGANLGGGYHHDFVHKIGRATAKAFGVNADAFFECPLEFNYGCPHGFFEQALIEAPDAKQAALNVCDPERMKDKPRKFYFYCYHGVGHGVMMAKAYDVKQSLDVCDGFETASQQAGCWQGVFMENTNGYGTTNMRANSFSKDDPLYPCDSLDDKYLWECYLNHAGYLINRMGPDARAAQVSAACLPAKEQGRTACLQGIGLMSTNADWQLRLVRQDTGDLLKNAVSICDDFPRDFRNECFTAGVDNLANFDRTDITRMVAFCALATAEFQHACYRQIGAATRNEIPDGDDGSSLCGGVPDGFRSDCRQGAGLSS